MLDAGRIEAPPIWPSVARVAATLAIFVSHYLGLIGRDQYRGLTFWALPTFMFLSGYLGQARSTSRVRWSARRYFSIMIPYWLVIIPVLIANWAVQYKPVSLQSGVVTVLGGNLFLDSPLYVITWSVTFVLLLYAYLLCDSALTGWTRLALTAAGFVVFGVFLDYGKFFGAFTVGLYLASWVPLRVDKSGRPATPSVSRLLFRLQDLCYPFFLAHGAVLLAVLKLTDVGLVPLFVVSFVITVGAALLIDRISRPLLQAALAATAPLRAQGHGTFSRSAAFSPGLRSML